MQQKIKRSATRTWLKRIVLFLLLWITIHIVYITIDGFRNFTGEADVAIILGNTVFKNDSLSSWLKGRVDAALDLYKAGKVKKIFASGGISKDANGNHPEGDAMEKYLLLQGVPAADIVADNKGQNTFLTARNFIAWNETQHYTSAVVVSQFYHITRSKYILRKLGFKNVSGASSTKYGWNDIIGTLREIPAFYKYLLWY
jgi:vancomycin permeability regulator SanA